MDELPQDVIPVSFGTIPLKPAGTFVYVALDGQARALYVGIADDLCARFAQHRQTSPWWPSAHNVEFERFTTRAEAMAVEKVYIRMLRPPHNTLHAGKRRYPAKYRSQQARYRSQQQLRRHLAAIVAANLPC